MEGMLNDLATAETQAAEFRGHLVAKKVALPRGMEFSVQVLTTGFWPSFPKVCRAAQRLLRRLRWWLAALSRVECALGVRHLGAWSAAVRLVRHDWRCCRAFNLAFSASFPAFSAFPAGGAAPARGFHRLHGGVCGLLRDEDAAPQAAGALPTLAHVQYRGAGAAVYSS